VSYPRPKGWNKAREWAKTCPVSRHAAMIADGLRDRRKGGYGKVLHDAGYDPDHMASSIEATVMSLWEARRYLMWENLPPTKRYKYNGHWVPSPPPQ
jgi:hypothetical protein